MQHTQRNVHVLFLSTSCIVVKINSLENQKTCGKVSVVHSIVSNLPQISLFVKMSENVVAPYGSRHAFKLRTHCLHPCSIFSAGLDKHNNFCINLYFNFSDYRSKTWAYLLYIIQYFRATAAYLCRPTFCPFDLFIDSILFV